MTTSLKIRAALGTPALIKGATPLRCAEGKKREFYVMAGGIAIKFYKTGCRYPLESLSLRLFGDRLELLSRKQVVARCGISAAGELLLNGRPIIRQGSPLKLFSGKWGSAKSVIAEDLFPAAFSYRSGPIIQTGVRFYLASEEKAILTRDFREGRISVLEERGHIELFRARMGRPLSFLRLSIDDAGSLLDSRGQPMKYHGADWRRINERQKFHLDKVFPWLKISREQLLHDFDRTEFLRVKRWVRMADDPDEIVFKLEELLAGGERPLEGGLLARGLYGLTLAADRLTGWEKMEMPERLRYIFDLSRFLSNFIKTLKDQGLLEKNRKYLEEPVETLKQQMRHFTAWQAMNR